MRRDDADATAAGRRQAGFASSLRRSSISSKLLLTTTAAMPARPSAFAAPSHHTPRRPSPRGTRGDDARDLGGRDVFAFPAEGIADAIDEIEKPLLVLAHEIAGAIPGIAGEEHVAQDLLARGSRRPCSPRSAWLPPVIHDLADRLAHLVEPRSARSARRHRARAAPPPRRTSPAPRARDATGMAECARSAPARPSQL